MGQLHPRVPSNGSRTTSGVYKRRLQKAIYVHIYNGDVTSTYRAPALRSSVEIRQLAEGTDRSGAAVLLLGQGTHPPILYCTEEDYSCALISLTIIPPQQQQLKRMTEGNCYLCRRPGVLRDPNL